MQGNQLGNDYKDPSKKWQDVELKQWQDEKEYGDLSIEDTESIRVND